VAALTPAQATQYAEHRTIDTWVGGRCFRLTACTVYNVEERDPATDAILRRYCARVDAAVPLADTLLAQLLWLRHNPDGFFAVANVMPGPGLLAGALAAFAGAGPTAAQAAAAMQVFGQAAEQATAQVVALEATLTAELAGLGVELAAYLEETNPPAAQTRPAPLPRGGAYLADETRRRGPDPPPAPHRRAGALLAARGPPRSPAIPLLTL